MIQILDEDIIFNELQQDCCKDSDDPCCGINLCIFAMVNDPNGGPPIPCPALDPQNNLPCPNCSAPDCTWLWKRVPGIGNYANFVSGCGGAPNCGDNLCKDCPTDNTPCVVTQAPCVNNNPRGAAEPAKTYNRCSCGCASPPAHPNTHSNCNCNSL